MKSLIIYFSREGENYCNGTIENLKQGNTEVVAKKIAALTNADLFKVESIKKYPSDYYACTEEAKDELNKNLRPQIKQKIKTLADYDVIFIGYPIWWGTMPMPMFSALENLDFSGKTVVPFSTHEGSGMGFSEKDVAKIAKGATIKKGLAIKGSTVQACDSKVKTWLKSVFD